MAKQTFPGRGKELNHIAERLRTQGYTPKFLKDFVPDWWSAESEATPGALAELKVALSQRLGLDIEEMLRRSEPVPVPPQGVRFKKATNQLNGPVDVTLAFCAAVARAVAATLPPSIDLPLTGDEIRSAILADDAVPYVALEPLLKYSWAHNIAVLYVDELPVIRKGMDALALRVDDRSVVIVTRRTDTQAWAAFHIAHELAHIALHHVGKNEALLDEGDEHTDSSSLEGDADAFALEAFGGRALRDFWTRHDSSPRDFAAAAVKRSPQYRVDPAHVVLRYGFERDWKFAQTALKYVETSSQSPRDLINSVAAQNLDLSTLDDDLGEMVSTVLRVA